MNDIQLSILLDKYSSLLWEAFRQIEEQLPDEMSEMRKPFLGEPQKVFPALDLLADVIRGMDDDVEVLRNTSDGVVKL